VFLPVGVVFGNFATMRIIAYLIAGDLDFAEVNPHVKVLYA